MKISKKIFIFILSYNNFINNFLYSTETQQQERSILDDEKSKTENNNSIYYYWGIPIGIITIVLLYIIIKTLGNTKSTMSKSSNESDKLLDTASATQSDEKNRITIMLPDRLKIYQNSQISQEPQGVFSNIFQDINKQNNPHFTVSIKEVNLILNFSNILELLEKNHLLEIIKNFINKTDNESFTFKEIEDENKTFDTNIIKTYEIESKILDQSQYFIKHIINNQNQSNIKNPYDIKIFKGEMIAENIILDISIKDLDKSIKLKYKTNNNTLISIDLRNNQLTNLSFDKGTRFFEYDFMNENTYKILFENAMIHTKPIETMTSYIKAISEQLQFLLDKDFSSRQ